MVTAALKKKIRRILEDSGIDCAEFETEQLLKWSLGENYYITGFDGEIEGGREKTLTEAAIRRARGEPLQYILGEWDFYGYTFKVGDGVLIPRQETELLAEKTLPYINESSTVIDLCSGSGCIPIAISKESGAKCIGVEISREAINYFNENIRLNNIADNVRAMEGDVLNPKRELLEALPKADLITANPPYLTAEEMQSLQREVRHEPEIALYGGRDGLDFYRSIFEVWKPKLKPDGIFAVEVGDEQSGPVTELMESKGFKCKAFKDYGGVERVVLGEIQEKTVKQRPISP